MIISELAQRKRGEGVSPFAKDVNTLFQTRFGGVGKVAYYWSLVRMNGMEVCVQKLPKLVAGGAMALASAGLLWLSDMSPLQAADHFDPPSRVDPAATTKPDFAADIADLYIFHTATSLVVALDFGGPQAANLPAYYDRDVLYKIMLSNAGSPTDAEFNIAFRFGQDVSKTNANGISVTGVPGTTGAIVGPAETTITQQGVKVFAGLIDDPFNFDAVGFRMTRETGTLSILNTRNRFFGLNSTVVVIEFPLSAIQNGTNPIAAWTTTARITPA
jgi:hypothetical protein